MPRTTTDNDRSCSSKSTDKSSALPHLALSLAEESSQSRICTIFSIAVFALFLIILSWLTINAAFFTSAISSDGAEHTFFVADNPFANLTFIAVSVAIAPFVCGIRPLRKLSSFVERSTKAYLICKLGLLSIMGLICLAWIVAVQAPPKADQLFVQLAVERFLSGNYADFSNSGYMGEYPQQIGLFWLSMAIACIVGPHQYFTLQIINVIGAMLIYNELAEIGSFIGMSKPARLATIAGGILFFPLLSYCSFIYGNIWGFALSLAAFRQELIFFDTDAHQLPHALVSALSIGLAITVKGNYAVFFIGMFVYGIVRTFNSRKLIGIAFAFLLVLSYGAQAIIPANLARYATGHEIDQGSATLSWIEMGLQNSEKAPGWFNGYNRTTYAEAGFNTAKQLKQNQSDLKETLQYFAKHQRYAAEFFVEKTASQWNNPTFQCFWIDQTALLIDKNAPNKLAFLSPAHAEIAARYLNFVQLFILFGAVLFCIFTSWGSADGIRHCLIPLIFIGGFLCHLVWEAKCQYTIPYFTLLIPLAIRGFTLASEQLSGKASHSAAYTTHANSRTSSNKPIGRFAPAIACISLTVTVFCFMWANGMSDWLTADTPAYAEYLLAPWPPE